MAGELHGNRGRSRSREPYETPDVHGSGRKRSESTRSYVSTEDRLPTHNNTTTTTRGYHRSPSHSGKRRERQPFYAHRFLFPFFTSFNIKGLNLAFGALMYGYKDIQLSSHHTYFAMSWVGALYTAALLGTFPLAKLITDLLGSRRFQSKSRIWNPVVITFGVCFRSSLLLGIPSVTSSTALIILHGVLLGTTDGILYSLSIITLDPNFQKQPLKWGAIIRIGASLGGLVYAAILRTCLSTVHFEWGVRIIALCGAGTMIPALFFLPDARPICLEYSPDKRKVLIFEDIVGEPAEERRHLTGNKGPSYTLMVCGLFFTFSSLYYGYHYVVLYGVHMAHRSPEDSIILVVEMCVCHTFGIVISTILKRFLRDQLGVLTFAILCMSQTVFTWIGADKNAGLIMFVCFYGFYSAAVDSIHLTCQLTYANSYADADRTQRMRYKMLYFFLAMSLGAVVGGASASCLIDYFKGVFWSASFLSAAGPFLGSLCFLAAVAMLGCRT